MICGLTTASNRLYSKVAGNTHLWLSFQQSLKGNVIDFIQYIPSAKETKNPHKKPSKRDGRAKTKQNKDSSNTSQITNYRSWIIIIMSGRETRSTQSGSPESAGWLEITEQCESRPKTSCFWLVGFLQTSCRGQENDAEWLPCCSAVD